MTRVRTTKPAEPAIDYSAEFEREIGEMEREGRERAARVNGPAAPDSYIAGTCRICAMGEVVVRVRFDRARRGPPDVRAYCVYCMREVEPHEVEPLPGGRLP
jgi:hypothetical protein